MCDNTNIHERVQASIATATREVDTALESVRAMRRAILAQMAEATSKVDFERDIYLKDGEYIDLLKCKDQVKAIKDLHKPCETSLGVVCFECRDQFGSLMSWPCDTSRHLA